MHRFLFLAAAALACQDPTDPDTSPGPTDGPTAETGTPPSPAVPLAESLDAERMLAHLDALQAIADAEAGHRSLLSTGYVASADYVADQLASFGYTVRRESFLVSVYVNDVATLEQTAPTAQTYASPTDFIVSPFSGDGVVSAAVVAVDPVLPPGATANASTAGCEATDFDGFPAGAVALIQRGTCAFATKFQNAVTANASAVIFFNEGQKGRTDPIGAQVAAGALAPIPAIGIGFDLGQELATAASPTVALEIQGHLLTGTDDNVIAETGGDPSRVVMLGGHLDSVPEGPGINDNGSGVAFLLELARQFAGRPAPRDQVRFAFWGAEEVGLVGAAAWLTDPYTGGFDKAKLASLQAYLNFDMMASPNGTRFVYDGDGSDVVDVPYPSGSAELETRFLDWFAAQGQPVSPVSALTRFDAFWFAAGGVPTGGVFSGATDLKTEAEAGSAGGTAWQPYDACYHQPCDDRANIDTVVFEDLARAAAHVAEALADPPDGSVTDGAQRDVPDRLPAAPVSGCHEPAALSQ